MVRIGKGMVTSGGSCRGTLRIVESVQDVLNLMKTDLSDVILLTTSASATAVTPLFSKISGVLCTSGGPTSHLAIVAREFDIPCLMGCELKYSGTLEGQTVQTNGEGEIFLET